jgi:ATP-dependent Zn protease
MTQTWTELIVAWLPLVILVGLWFIVMRRMNGPTGISQGQYMHEILAETKRQNEALFKLLAVMDERLKRLEARDQTTKGG